MLRIFPALFALLFSLHCLTAQTLVPEWTQFQNTDSNSGLPTVNLPFVLIDSFSNVIVCGSTYRPGAITGFITTKYDSTGNWLWEQKYDWFSLDQIWDAGTDEAGNVYVTGNTGDPVTGLSAFVLFKYTPAGDTSWSYWYTAINEPQVSTYIRKMFVLPNQNIILVGGRINYQTQVGAAMVICLSPDKEVLWEAQLHGAGNRSARIVDDQIVCWGRINTPAGLAFNCWTVDMQGQTIDSFTTSTYVDDYQNHFHIDTKGNLYIGDYYGEYKVTKYNTKGELEWFYQKPYFQGPAQNYVTARASGIVADKDGNVWFSGIYYGGESTGRNFIVTFLNDKGELQWEHYLHFDIMDGNDGTGMSFSQLTSQNHCLSTGQSTTDISLNHIAYPVVEYDQEGFVRGGISVSEGIKIAATYVLEHKDSWCIAGYQWDTLFSEKHFVSKIKIPEMVNAVEPDKPQDNELTVFPNPVKDELYISNLSFTSDAALQVHIIDQQGRIKFTYLTEAPNNPQGVLISGLQVLAQGYYTVVMVQNGKISAAGRFFKL